MPETTRPALVWRPATLADGPVVLELIRAFYAEEKIAFTAATQGRALDCLLADPSLGAVFLLQSATPDLAVGSPSVTASETQGAFGHLVLTRGHSLEFGGRFLLLDELYLVPGIRGHGEGKRALDFAAAFARDTGAQALRLEVSHENHRARETYRRAGFVTETRDLMTLRLD